MFKILDYSYLLFEKILFWKLPKMHFFDATPVNSGSLWLYCVLGGVFAGMAFIITRHFLKKRAY
jgi:uncharacterized membrane-anchored protein YitT (DUF2179 family)